MKIINGIHEADVQILINEFLVAVQIESKDDIPIVLIKYLRDRGFKIEDSSVFDEFCLLIERKYFL